MFLRWEWLTKGVDLTGVDSEPNRLPRASILIPSFDSKPGLKLGSELLQVSPGWCVLDQAASQWRLFRQLGEQRSCLVLTSVVIFALRIRLIPPEYAGHTPGETNLPPLSYVP